MKKHQKLLDLKPTQFAIGIAEVHEKIAAFEKLKKRGLKKFVEDNPIPIVVSPLKEMYLVDHHHFLFTCWHLGVKKVRVKVVCDLSRKKYTLTQFWKFMARHNYFYPFCQFGEGPRDSLYLPQDIRGLADDPYRSLAWFVRKDGGYENTDEPFAEFQWANLFRKRKLLHRNGRVGLNKAVKQALKIAKSPVAKGLPGFRGAGEKS